MRTARQTAIDILNDFGFKESSVNRLGCYSKILEGTIDSKFKDGRKVPIVLALAGAQKLMLHVEESKGHWEQYVCDWEQDDATGSTAIARIICRAMADLNYRNV